MNRTSRLVATLAVSAALFIPLAAPANAAGPVLKNQLVSGPISAGGGTGGQVSTYGVSDAVNDWICRNLGALCR
ncbi:hypothetical protein [Paeniglutamicibacter cryotolerans]|uniref:Uncharacterized protein n=1 Tax=Paeniglutamicibacter cryotolerans TaxID=670079 RepID=A0A839QFZ0_9MICC|nr:hypothetical protein [Paeniglutamicibacter cryotolerans]MBB2995218.1 hypothetical protein [Paeniglutamicibacter cryotolerans]